MHNINDILINQVKLNPDKLAIIDDIKQISFKQLHIMTQKCGSYLNSQGINQDDVIIHMFKDQILTVVSMFATARLGATMISVSTSITNSFLKQIIKSSNAKWIITDSEIKEDINLKQIVYNQNSYQNVSLKTPIYISKPKSPWQIIIGSGSTGKNKLIPVTHTQEIYRTQLWTPTLSNDIVTSFSEITYSGVKRRILETIYAGAIYYIFNKNSNIIDSRVPNITILHTSTFFIERILNKLNQNEIDFFSKLKVLVLGGSKVSNNLIKRINESLTKNLYIRYATNEIGTICYGFGKDISLISGLVGKNLDGVNVEIVDKDLNKLSNGETGLIRIKSPGVIDGYLNDDEATKKAFKDGCFYPGDIGKFTEDGQLIHLGRADDMMIMNGINIYPSQIENEMLKHPEVLEAYSFPFKHDVHQDIPVCAVLVKENSNTSEKSLLQYAFEYLGSYRPQLIVILDKTPRNQQGKVVRKELIEMVQQKLDKNKHVPISRKYKQPTMKKQFTLTHVSGDLNTFDKDLKNLFNVNLEEKYSPTITPRNEQEEFILEIVWRILIIRRELLQAITLPIFDIGEIISVNKYEDKFIIEVLVPYVEEINSNFYSDIDNLSLSLLAKIDNFQDQNKKNQFFLQLTNHLNNFKRTYNINQGKSTFPILKIAHLKQIPFEHLGSSLYQLGWGKNSRIISRSATWEDSYFGVTLSENKIATSLRVRNMGLPAPVHGIAKDFEEAVNIVKQINFPVVTKPINLNRGEGVSVDITDLETLKKGFELANINNNPIIVERQVNGVCTRIFVANKKMYYAVKRLPKSIIGDGKHTVNQLINIANKENQQLPPWKRTEYFPLDEEALTSIYNEGYNLEDIPNKDDIVPLRRIESTQSGGYDEDVTNSIHPKNIEIAIKAADIFGLHVAGVDIISPDITKPWYENGAIINEVNFAPLYGGGEIARSTIPSFLDDFINDNGRIPITVLIGDNEAFEKAKQLQSEKISEHKDIYITSHDKTVDNLQNEIIMPLNSLYKRTKALLMNKNVEELILVIQTDELLTRGLPIDNINKLIIVNNKIAQNENQSVSLNKIVSLLNTICIN